MVIEQINYEKMSNTISSPASQKEVTLPHPRDFSENEPGDKVVKAEKLSNVL